MTNGISCLSIIVENIPHPAFGIPLHMERSRGRGVRDALIMKYKVQLNSRYIPDKELIADLRKTAKKLRKTGRKKHVSFIEYRRDGRFNPATLYGRFGSWNAALLKAGLKTVYKIPASEPELLFNLKRVWDALGRQPLFDDMRCPISEYHPSVYPRRFGSWNRALFALEKACKNGKLKAFKPKPGEIRNSTKLRIRKPDRPQIESSPHVSKSLRFDVFNRDRFRCRLCGASPANDLKVTLHADHIIPVSKGGKTILSNLQTTCRDCNLGKKAKLISLSP